VRIIIEFGLVIVEKGSLNWINSKSTIGLMFMLEDCKRGLGVRLVQRSNIVENLSGCEGLNVLLG
jgi:hypothetical protein